MACITTTLSATNPHLLLSPAELVALATEGKQCGVVQVA